MPPRKRRQSVPGDDNSKENLEKLPAGTTSSADNEKPIKGAPKGVEASSIIPEKRLTARQQSIQDANAEKVKHAGPAAPADAATKPAPPQPTRFSTRVVKRPRREFSPVESSPAKKARAVKPAVTLDGKVTTTPETKTKRQWELWSVEDKDTFFEGLCEYGKDFDSIHNAIVVKCKKKGAACVGVKNKEQVRHFYYRTWHKISKLIQPKEDTKKDIQEVYGLISYGVLRKKLRRGINFSDKNWQKLNELVHFGAATVKVKGKRIRVKTPMCKALKKLNNIEEPRREPGPKVPEKIKVEFRPRTNLAWSHVQDLAQNPRLRMTVRPDRGLESLLTFLERKWRPQRVKLKESMSEVEAPLQELRVYPHRASTVTCVNLEAVDEPVYRFSLNNHRDSGSIHSSPTSTKKKKDCPEPRKCGHTAVTDSSEASKAVITDFKCCVSKDLAKPDIINKTCVSTSKDSTNSKPCVSKNCSCKDANKQLMCRVCVGRDVCASKDLCSCSDTSCMFSGETTTDSEKSKRISSVQNSLNFMGGAKKVMFEACENGASLQGTQATATSEVSAIADGENAMFPDFATRETTDTEKVDPNVKTEVDSQENTDLPTNIPEVDENTCNSVESSRSGMVRVCRDIMNHGWSTTDVENVTIAELYFMFGKDGELRFEYEWCNKEVEPALTPDLVLANLNNKLRRLFNLATVEFTDFSKTPGVGSPCHMCGQTVGPRPARGKDRSPGGKSKLGRTSTKEIGVQTQGNVMFQRKEPVNIAPAVSSLDGVFRVPVVTPALNATQRSILSMSDKELVQRLNPDNPTFNRPLQPRRLKSVSRKPVTQRTILPKAELATQKYTFYVPNQPADKQNLINQINQTIVGHPLGIKTQPSSPGTTVDVNSPSATISSASLGSPHVSASPTGVLDSSLESGCVTPPPSYSVLDPSLSPGDGDHTLLRISASEIGSLSLETLKAAGLSTRESPVKREPDKKSPSPPNLSSLLDLSFSNMAPGELSVVAEPSFTGYLEDGGSKSPLTVDPGLITPPLRSTSDSQTTPTHSPPTRSMFKITSPNPETQWLNGDVADMSLTSFLELPLKTETSSASFSSAAPTFTSQSLLLFNEFSRDSQSARIDVDSTLQCMMNESSVDYVKKFADLAEQISQTDNGHRKPETNIQTA